MASMPSVAHELVAALPARRHHEHERGEERALLQVQLVDRAALVEAEQRRLGDRTVLVQREVDGGVELVPSVRW